MHGSLTDGKEYSGRTFEVKVPGIGGGVARKEKGSALLDDTGEPVADGIDTEISPLRRPHNPSIL